jgi:hypothetical protein
MGQIGVVVFPLILVVLGVLILSQRWLVDALTEAMTEAINNLRGGPPTAMHPSLPTTAFSFVGRPER